MSRMSGYKVRINTNTADDTAIILLVDGALIGVLSELVDECHGADQGKWSIESAFGFDDHPFPAIFESAAEAANWLGSRVAADRFNSDGQMPELH